MRKPPTRSRLEKTLDDVFQRWIKKRDGYTCQRCHNQYREGDRGIQASHFWSRQHRGTRWDESNVDSLCYGCHVRVEGDKQGWYRDFKMNQLGAQGYAAMEMRARGITKFSSVDLQMLIDLYRKKLR